jgi:hypothetical protein
MQLCLMAQNTHQIKVGPVKGGEGELLDSFCVHFSGTPSWQVCVYYRCTTFLYALLYEYFLCAIMRQVVCGGY